MNNEFEQLIFLTSNMPTTSLKIGGSKLTDTFKMRWLNDN